MLEIFLRDRDIDFEFLKFSSKGVKYFTRDTYSVDYSKKELYRHLNNGTILLDGEPVYVNNVSEDQINYIRHYIELYKEKVIMYKKDYKPCYVKYRKYSNFISSLIKPIVIEVPNKNKFKEWSYIKGMEYLEEFVNEYDKQFSISTKVRKRIFKR